MSDFKARMHKIRFPLGLRPDPTGGAYSAPPKPLGVLKGHISKGEEGGEGKGRGGESESREREKSGRRRREGRGGASPPKYSGLEPPLADLCRLLSAR